jgi:dihydrofolate synthase/folylpolyglutamate synthase
VTTQKSKPTTVDEWLLYIEALHPKSIAMGLDRVRVVAEKLKLKTTFPIITVAGTNGKGSVCAMLSHIYHQSGYKVGTYTSPHLNRYNERVSINLEMIDDDALCKAFEEVEVARGEVALTYFEMGTLAAMSHFCHQHLDVLVLEVGLGGRLDAVNVFEPSCAIVTTVDLDHMEFLGETRELIGLEKAGVFRSNLPAICGDDNFSLVASHFAMNENHLIGALSKFVALSEVG